MWSTDWTTTCVCPWLLTTAAVFTEACGYSAMLPVSRAPHISNNEVWSKYHWSRNKIDKTRGSRSHTPLRAKEVLVTRSDSLVYRRSGVQSASLVEFQMLRLSPCGSIGCSQMASSYRRKMMPSNVWAQMVLMFLLQSHAVVIPLSLFLSFLQSVAKVLSSSIH